MRFDVLYDVFFLGGLAALWGGGCYVRAVMGGEGWRPVAGVLVTAAGAVCAVTALFAQVFLWTGGR